MIIAGVNDGSIQVWHARNNNWRPDIIIKGHEADSEVTHVQFFEDNTRFISRSSDSTLKYWDLRKTKMPIMSWSDLALFNAKTSACISPDESIVGTGTNVKKNHQNSSLIFFSLKTGEKLNEIDVCRSSLVSIQWHPKINQFLNKLELQFQMLKELFEFTSIRTQVKTALSLHYLESLK